MGGLQSSMARLMLRRLPEVPTKCPHCHEDVCESEPRLVVGEKPFHRNCWVREIIGPTENRTQGVTLRQEADASVSAWENKRRP